MRSLGAHNPALSSLGSFMRSVHTIAMACLFTLLASLSTVALSPAASAATAVLASDSSADGARLLRADLRDTHTIFSTTFRTLVPNEKHRTMADLNLTVSKTASDPFLVATYTIYCAPAGSGRGDNKISGSQNIPRGGSLVHKPQYLFTAPTPGLYECWVRLSAGRPRPASTRPESNTITVGSGSYLQVTKTTHPASTQGYTPAAPSTVVAWHKSAGVAAAHTSVPLTAKSVAVSGRLWVTSCTAKEGSLDPVTGAYLCANRINRAGTKLVSKVVVAQRKIGGGVCKRAEYPGTAGRTSSISADLHHTMISDSGEFTLSRELFCSRSIYVQIHVTQISGAAFVVHSQGTITMAIMPDSATI